MQFIWLLISYLKDSVASRAMSKEEKRQLGQSLGRLPPEKLSKAIQIIAQENPSLNTFADQVEIDIEAQVYFHFYPNSLWTMLVFEVVVGCLAKLWLAA